MMKSPGDIVRSPLQPHVFERKERKELNLSTRVMAAMFLRSLRTSGHSGSSVRRGKRSSESGLPGVGGAERSDVC